MAARNFQVRADARSRTLATSRVSIDAPGSRTFRCTNRAVVRSNSTLVAYRHGFRVSELIALRWDVIEFDNGRMHVNRAKDGLPSVHPIREPELRALRRLKRENPSSPYVFVTERKGALTDSAVRKMIARAGEHAGFDFSIHPHMLRHSTGYKLANDGHDTRAIQQYLGHKNIQHTVRYTQLSANRFKDFWQD